MYKFALAAVIADVRAVMGRKTALFLLITAAPRLRFVKFKTQDATRCLKIKPEFDFEKIIRQKAWFLANSRRFSRRAILASGVGNHFEMVSIVKEQLISCLESVALLGRHENLFYNLLE